MNQTQTLTTFAPVVTFFAGLLAGKGVFGFDEATWIAVLSGLATAAIAVYGSIVTRKKALITQVNALPDVAGVVTANTIEGRALAASVPSTTVAIAGSAAAKMVAADGAVG